MLGRPRPRPAGAPARACAPGAVRRSRCGADRAVIVMFGVVSALVFRLRDVD